MDPIHPLSADIRSCMQEVDYTGGHPYRDTITELEKHTTGTAHLYPDCTLAEGQEDLYNQHTTSEKSEHLAQGLGEDQRFGGGVKVQGESGTCLTKESSLGMSSRECIQRRKWKLEERSLSWDVLDTGGFAGELHQDNGGDMVEVKLEKAEGSQPKQMNVILYKMEEDQSRLWSEGHNLSRAHTEHATTKPSPSIEGDDRMRKVKLYRRAQSENLVSYLQGSIRALTRSASESSDGHRQVTRLSLQRIGKSHSTDHLLEGVEKMVSSVHALMCSSIQVQAQGISKNSHDKGKEPLARSRGPPKRIYQLEASCKDNLSDSEEERTRYTREDPGLHAAAEEGTLWNIGAAQNAKPPEDTPPSPCTEVVKGVFSGETVPQARNSSEPKQGDPEEDKVLSVADARRAFEASSTSKRKAVASHSKRGGGLCRQD
ncbi:coronin-1C isoform X2 [Hyla sarda]|uniref:coronin-1C isoform X2 n=1 Tax=Hyla sarda TaxID=327740 RepID=UPI0024C395DD|nr:coronin-1C isoform X2 [Hyla sarda]